MSGGRWTWMWAIHPRANDTSPIERMVHKLQSTPGKERWSSRRPSSTLRRKSLIPRSQRDPRPPSIITRPHPPPHRARIPRPPPHRAFSASSSSSPISSPHIHPHPKSPSSIPGNRAITLPETGARASRC